MTDAALSANRPQAAKPTKRSIVLGTEMPHSFPLSRPMCSIPIVHGELRCVVKLANVLDQAILPAECSLAIYDSKRTYGSHGDASVEYQYPMIFRPLRSKCIVH